MIKTFFKTVFKILIFIIGLVFVLVSIVGISDGDILLGGFTMAMGTAMVFMAIRKALFKQKNNSIPDHEKDAHVSEVIKVSTTNISDYEMEIGIGVDEKKLVKLIQQNQKKEQAKIDSFIYEPLQISSTVHQVMESVYIIDASKNMDTLRSRNQFVKGKIEILRLAAHNKRYITDAQYGIDQYKTMYYDRMPTEQQIAILIKPNEDDYEEFYCQCILNCFNRFYDEQNKQMAKLKTHDSIKKRQDNIMDSIRDIQMMLPTMANSYIEVNNKLEAIYKKVYEDTYKRSF